MNAEWMYSRSDWVFRGDRRTGLNFVDDCTRILITEVIESKKLWVVYVTDTEEGAWHSGVICDGCNLVSVVTGYNYLACWR